MRYRTIIHFGSGTPAWTAIAPPRSGICVPTLLVRKRFYQPVGGKAKVLLDLLMDHPGRQLDVDELCELSAGTFSGSRSIAGSITGMVKSHQASDRRYPFYWWEGTPSRYAMKKSVAELFRLARTNVGC